LPAPAGKQTLQIVQASAIPINSTYEVDVANNSMTAEEFGAALDAEAAVKDQLYAIMEDLRTSEGIDNFDKICGFTTEMNSYKVMECYGKNKDKIK
jgi:hypothetical protein